MKQTINIVWIKRDIRSQDHAPFQAAEMASYPYLIIYLFEPEMISYKDTSLRHLQFQYHSLQDLNKTLSVFNRKVNVLYGDALKVFSYLNESFHIDTVFSYQESGTLITYNRDILVEELFVKHGIKWKQFQRDGIIRAIKNRDGWTEAWDTVMHAPIIQNHYSKVSELELEHDFQIPDRLLNVFQKYADQMQPPGEQYAFKYLKSFLEERGNNYSKHISKPTESRISCGRLSPYISWGNISIRQVYQFASNLNYNKINRRSTQNFLTRLHWHCHFIQKFEMECAYEFYCLNKVYEELELPRNDFFIRAWERGETGFPLVDASMRCLHSTGWINFRMRAMLVSFFCHHLMQDWRDGVYHLAKLFLDYEPGIHYPQFQMQAGTTGVNTIRIYNPVKQSKEQDPEGVFIKKWLPQLKYVPTDFIHEPHTMNLFEQQQYKVVLGVDYPWPIIDITKTGKIARDVYWGIKRSPTTKIENKKILAKHVRS